MAESPKRNRPRRARPQSPKPLLTILKIIFFPLILIWWVLGPVFRPIFRILFWPFRKPYRAIRKMLRGERGDMRSRRFAYLLQGLPALLVLVLAVYSLLGAAVFTKSELHEIYRNAAITAFDEKDMVSAQLYIQRAMGLAGMSDRDLSFKYALIELDQRNTEMAMNILTKLAPLESQGHLPVHRWWAMRLMGKPRRSQSEQYALESHLMTLYKADPKDAQINGMLAVIYLEKGQAEKATKYLDLGVSAYPFLRLEVARRHREEGRPQHADRELRTVEGFYDRQLYLQPKSFEIRLRLAEAKLARGNLNGALEVMVRGNQLDPSWKYRDAISRLLMDSVFRQTDLDLESRVRMVDQALRFNPKNKQALWYLVQLASRPEGRSNEEVCGSLASLIANADSSIATAHLIFALHDMEANEGREARWHLEQAYQIDRTEMQFANNLAWLLTYSQEPDFERALLLIDSVIERNPHPRFQDTRGHVLLKMGRHAEAAKSLEVALAGLPDTSKPTTHAALAEAYEAIGQTAIANEHRRRAGRYVDVVKQLLRDPGDDEEQRRAEELVKRPEPGEEPLPPLADEGEESVPAAPMPEEADGTPIAEEAPAGPAPSEATVENPKPQPSAPVEPIAPVIVVEPRKPPMPTPSIAREPAPSIPATVIVQPPSSSKSAPAEDDEEDFFSPGSLGFSPSKSPMPPANTSAEPPTPASAIPSGTPPKSSPPPRAPDPSPASEVPMPPLADDEPIAEQKGKPVEASKSEDAIGSDSKRLEPAKTEAAKTEAAKTEATKTEATKTEATKTEPAKTEPAKSEPQKPAEEDEGEFLSPTLEGLVPSVPKPAPKPAPKATPRPPKRTTPADSKAAPEPAPSTPPKEPTKSDGKEDAQSKGSKQAPPKVTPPRPAPRPRAPVTERSS